MLICADVIRPGLDWLLRFAPARHNLATEMARTRDPRGVRRARRVVHAGPGRIAERAAGTDPGRGHHGRQGRPGRAGAGRRLRRASRVAAGMRATCRAHANSPLFYQLLRAHGGLGPDAPAAIEMFSGRGQPSCEQLIDRYRIACRPVRDVLVDYLRERQPSVDFSSLQRHAYLLGKLFWADLEAHHPGIDSLKLPRDVAAAWKQRVMTRTRTTTAPDRRTGHGDRAAIGRAQRAHRGAGLLPRYRRVGRRRPGPMGTLGGALPGQRQRRLAQEGPLTPQVPHGPTHFIPPAISRHEQRRRTTPRAG